jgi:hypothetical protein
VMSNSKEILAKFPDEEKAPKFRDIYAKDNQSLPSTKALGVALGLRRRRLLLLDEIGGKKG